MPFPGSSEHFTVKQMSAVLFGRGLLVIKNCLDESGWLSPQSIWQLCGTNQSFAAAQSTSIARRYWFLEENPVFRLAQNQVTAICPDIDLEQRSSRLTQLLSRTQATGGIMQ